MIQRCPPEILDLVVKVGEAWYDIYVGRNPAYGDPKWGNPFIIGKDGTREEVVGKHMLWLPTQKHLIRSLPDLRGKVLGCHCLSIGGTKPVACHAITLAYLANCIDISKWR